ncbi:MAG: CAAX prenyl protease-related protein [Roseateles depolymerans]|uniref:CAAX prenyl protease-related protein n=1 Tax=Roseateles depolymerans TaxID=76731 RepID=A0A2W5DUA1_9BURK|nr:MAG: CAAX prenyl protease-related protein [Roseateles depolymerans]
MPNAYSLSPAALARLVPFAVFMLLLALRGYLPPDLGLDPRWIYALQTLIVAGLLAWYWRDYGELARQNLPDAREVGWAVVVGIAVFALWVKLDAPWMTLGEPTASFVPLQPDGRLDWPLIVFRLAGAALVVPLMEELFWRSFLMRWLERPGFEWVDPQRVGLKAVVLSTFVFTLAHTLWLAAIIAGLAYALLYRWSGRLWTAVIAHAVTNGLLGLWVIASHRWEFW